MGCVFSCFKHGDKNKTVEPLLTEVDDPTIAPDHFKIEKILGRGNFGKVCLVRKIGSEQLYAMKILKKRVIEEKKQRVHTITERKVLENSQCPFIVKLCYAFQTPTKLYMAMEVHERRGTFFPFKQRRYLQ